VSLHSAIEWTDATWNPVRGCVKISPGCKHCYAETFAERFRGVKGHPYEQGFDLRLVPEKLPEPFTWRSPKLVFVFAAERENIWWGVSVEDRKHGLPRVDHLRQAPAKVRFLSIEPLLEDLGEIDLSGITWVIVGGESGPGARPMKREWVVSIRKQCRTQGEPFFFKQWGGVRKARNGRLLDGRTYDEYPNRVIGQVPDRGDCMKRAADFIASFSTIHRDPLVQITA
jgi:protein gp37